MSLHNKLTAFLNRPSHLLVSEKKGWFYILSIGIIIPLLLKAQQPYGIYCWQHPYKNYLLCGYGLTFLVSYILIYGVMRYVFPRYFKSETWTLGKDMGTSGILLILVGTNNWWYNSVFIEQSEISANSLLVAQYYTLVFGFLPKLCTSLFACYKAHTKIIPSVHTIDVEAESEELSVTETVQINSDSIVIHSIQYIQSVENYVTLHLHLNNMQEKRTYYKTLKGLKQKLSGHPQFVQCHKSFIVNTHFIAKSKCNSAGGYLMVKNITEKIPVSRYFYPGVKKVLTR